MVLHSVVRGAFFLLILVSVMVSLLACGSRIDKVAEAISIVTVDAINLRKSTDEGDTLPCDSNEMVCGTANYEYCLQDVVSELGLANPVITSSKLTATITYDGGIKTSGLPDNTAVDCTFDAEMNYNSTAATVTLPLSISSCDNFSCTAGKDTYNCEDFKKALAKVDCAPVEFPTEGNHLQ